jgi:hypothetical protein
MQATPSTPLGTSIAREALSVQSMPELARLLRQLRGREAGRQRAGWRNGAEWTYRELDAAAPRGGVRSGMSGLM